MPKPGNNISQIFIAHVSRHIYDPMIPARKYFQFFLSAGDFVKNFSHIIGGNIGILIPVYDQDRNISLLYYSLLVKSVK